MVHHGGVVIYNPTAGRGRAGKLREQAQAMLGSGFEWVPTMKAGHAEDLAREAAKLAQAKAAKGEAQIVVAYGGDGTVGDVMRGILGSEATLGIIPVGTGNDLARNLGLKLDLQEAVATVLNGVVRRIDIGTANGTPFINNAGTGFDAAVMKTMNTGIKKARGQFAFQMAILKTFPGYKPFTLTVETGDGETITEKAFLVSILNGKMYGGGMMAAPAADMDDGQLDVMIIKAMPKLPLLLSLMPQVTAGRHQNHAAVRMLKVRNMKVTTTPPQPLNIDGDVRGLTPLEIGVMPMAMKVLVR
jgi:YegS/Rv2252/BmrU family lipid kinase